MWGSNHERAPRATATSGQHKRATSSAGGRTNPARPRSCLRRARRGGRMTDSGSTGLVRWAVRAGVVAGTAVATTAVRRGVARRAAARRADAVDDLTEEFAEELAETV